MFVSLLSLAMIGQWDRQDPDPATIDLAFTRAVEEFAARAAPRLSPPDPCRSLIARMGSRGWEDREAASKAMEAACRTDPTMARWLFWGRMSRDPEIVVRCNAIVRRLNPCGGCGGSGRSKVWDEYPCWTCEGTGTAWPFSPWG